MDRTDLVRLEELARAAVIARDVASKDATPETMAVHVKALVNYRRLSSPQTILHLIQLLKDREGALRTAIDAIDAFALRFIMAHDGSSEDSDLRQEAFRDHVSDLCSVGVSIRQSLNTGAPS